MTDILDMSDEDFLNMVPPSGGATVVSEEVEDTTSQNETVEEKSETETAEEVVEEKETTETEDKVEGETKTETEKSTEVETQTETKEDKTPVVPPKVENKEPNESTQTVSNEVAQEFYTKVMAPFKANGRTVELKNPEEAVKLMQMGANYTKRMQELQPHRKALTMLQNNGLLDEGKLSFLIDLDKKNPEAIKKLIKDSGIDVLDIDTTAEPNYVAGSHRVTDEETNFRTAIEELTSSEGGNETLKIIDSTWDQASKEFLWDNPDVMNLMHAQRTNGTYDRIADEVHRLRLVGAIPVNVPFLEAYQSVGQQLYSADQARVDTNKSTQTTQVPTPVAAAQPANGTVKEVVDTRIVAPKNPVANGDKAAAASPSKSSSRQNKTFVNPLEMSDEEFLKNFNGRL